MRQSNTTIIQVAFEAGTYIPLQGKKKLKNIYPRRALDIEKQKIFLGLRITELSHSIFQELDNIMQ